jgi:hypothetical protein
MAGMREGSTTDDYRNACSGEGEFGSLGYDWADKPHRLVYDLCGEVDRLRASLIRIRSRVSNTSIGPTVVQDVFDMAEAALAEREG